MNLKRIIVTSVIAATGMFSLTGNAAIVGADAARSAANQFLKQKAAHMLTAPSLNDIKLAHAEASSVEGNAFYVFNIKGGGWIIIAGDDRAKQVLAYGDQGNISMNDLPENMKGYLNMLKGQIETAQAYTGKTVPVKAAKRSATIGPLLKTNWGQGEPMNRQCPMNGSVRTSVGCAPLAMAQIMYYWKYPTQVDAVPGYSISWNQYMSELPATTFDYDLILDSYHIYNPETGGISLGTYTDEEANEVAKLSRYCGQACKARYGNSGTTGTGSYTYDQRDAFKLFGFNEGMQLIGKDPAFYCDNSNKYSIEEWVELINTELEAGRPIPYHDTYEGHAWVLDGIDVDGKVHMNWGFYGKFNGWWEIDALAFHPNDDDEVWNFSQDSNGGNEMIIGMFPYEGYVIPGDDPQPQVKIGDVDGDGNINISDVTALIDLLLTDGSMTAGADVDGDGNLTISDVTALIDMLLTGGN